MRREARIILITLLLAGTWAAGTRVPEALASMQAFQVKKVDVRGAHHLAPDEVRRELALPEDATIWWDTGVWAERLRRHPLVADVRISRRLPATLVVEVRERVPVALVPTPVLEPVDAQGVRLPVDPAATRLDLPVVAPADPVAPRGRLVPAGTRRLLEEVARLMEGDTAFLRMVSEVAWHDSGALVARWSEPRVDILLHPGTSVHRFRQGLGALADALARVPDAPPTVVDLRYADQVVVRRSNGSTP